MIIGHERFPGYDSYKPTRQKTHELLEVIDSFMESEERFISLEFEDPEETAHAISILFSVANNYEDVHVDLRGTTVYVQKVEPIDFGEVEMLKVIFKEYK